MRCGRVGRSPRASLPPAPGRQGCRHGWRGLEGRCQSGRAFSRQPHRLPRQHPYAPPAAPSPAAAASPPPARQKLEAENKFHRRSPTYIYYFIDAVGCRQRRTLPAGTRVGPPPGRQARGGAAGGGPGQEEDGGDGADEGGRVTDVAEDEVARVPLRNLPSGGGRTSPSLNCPSSPAVPCPTLRCPSLRCPSLRCPSLSSLSSLSFSPFPPFHSRPVPLSGLPTT